MDLPAPTAADLEEFNAVLERGRCWVALLREEADDVENFMAGLQTAVADYGIAEAG